MFGTLITLSAGFAGKKTSVYITLCIKILTEWSECVENAG